MSAGFALGAPVAIEATVIGQSVFAEGRPTFLVQFTRCGRTEQLWFHAGDLVDDTGEADVEREGAAVLEDAA